MSDTKTAPCPPNRYWQKLVADSQELVAKAKGDDFAYVFVLQSKAILEIDEEVRRLRALVEKPCGYTEVENLDV